MERALDAHRAYEPPWYTHFYDGWSEHADKIRAEYSIDLSYLTREDLEPLHPVPVFENGIFDRVNFAGSDLRGFWFTEATLAGANLQDANLQGTRFYRAYLSGANLKRAKLQGADLRANLERAQLQDAKLQNAMIENANLREAQLQRADLSGADLYRANLDTTNLTDANLHKAHLERALLINTKLKGAILTGARVYGISAWDVETDKETKQTELIITPRGEPEVIVDDLEVAQFIYLLVNHKKIRNFIDSVTKKGVLILGRFGGGGIEVLQAIAAWLRKRENGGYLPMLFDFPRPDSKTYTETVRTLVGLARFVIVDLSGPSVPQEITATVDLHEIPFVPILEKSRKNWSMFKDFLVKERVIKTVRFTDTEHLLAILPERVIAPAEKLIAKRQSKIDEIFGSHG
jgi:hypothetical protein